MVQTLHSKLEAVAQKFPQVIAMQIKHGFANVSYSYAEVCAKAKEVAFTLIALGAKPGDRVAIVLENRPEWGIVYFGIMYAGGTAVPIDPQANNNEIYYYLTDTDSKFIFTSNRQLLLLDTVIAENRKNVKTLVLDAAPNQRLPSGFLQFSQVVKNAPSCVLPTITCDAIASIIYTSGTTGKAKGVILTHQNFYANFQSIAALQLFMKKDNFLALLPLHHVFPFMVTLLVPLFIGCRITYIENIKPDIILQAMRDFGVTVLVAVPQIFYLFYKAITTEVKRKSLIARIVFWFASNTLYFIYKITKINLAKYVFKSIHKIFGLQLRLLASGGAKLDLAVAKFFMQLGFTLFEGYGLSETAPVATFNALGPTKIGSAGKAIPNVAVKIIDPDKNNIGEVAIKGMNVTQGYWNNITGTTEVLKDGWFYSGDLGYLDKDKYLYIVGRKKELIVLSSGKNISPEEVENYYSQSPFIKELCVFEILGVNTEKLVAVIVPNLVFFQQVGEININEKIRWELENLSAKYPPYKRIMGFVIAKHDLVRTRLGKLKRYEIKDQYLSEFAAQATVDTTSEIPLNDDDLNIFAADNVKQIMAIISEKLNLTKPIQLNDHLELDLGVDSLLRVELLAAIENALRVSINEEVISRIFTVRDLIEECQKLQNVSNQNGSVNLKASTFLWTDYLKAIPSSEAINKINLNPTMLNKTIFIFCIALIGLALKTLWHLKRIYKCEFLPDKNYIFCANHSSFLDGFVIMAALPHWLKVKTFYIGDRPFFAKPGIRFTTKFLKIICIDAARYLLDAMQISAYVLRQNKSIVIFPEGERSIDGKIRQFKNGIGILTEVVDAVIVPVYIDGTFVSWPRTQKLPRLRPLTIVFGEPKSVIYLQESGFQIGAKNQHEAIATGIRNEVRLLEQNFKR